MSNAISLHIGLNRVDPNAYNGWDGALSGCINDAQSMQRIANSLGYVSTIILDRGVYCMLRKKRTQLSPRPQRAWRWLQKVLTPAAKRRPVQQWRNTK